jgi:hypothetical protein
MVQELLRNCKLATDQVGAGVYVYGRGRMKMKLQLGKYAEVYDAELTGILEAAEFYKNWTDADPIKRRLLL